MNQRSDCLVSTSARNGKKYIKRGQKRPTKTVQRGQMNKELVSKETVSLHEREWGWSDRVEVIALWGPHEALQNVSQDWLRKDITIELCANMIP